MIKTKGLPDLKNPSFVLATPRIYQYIAIGLLLIIGISSLFLGLNMMITDGVTFGSVMICIFSVIMVLLVMSPNVHNEWITFAADHNGIYLADRMMMHFIFVPWQKVGEIKVGLGESNDVSVILTVVMNDNEWNFLTGQTLEILNPAPDANSFRSIIIGNSTLSPTFIVEAINKIRNM